MAAVAVHMVIEPSTSMGVADSSMAEPSLMQEILPLKSEAMPSGLLPAGPHARNSNVFASKNASMPLAKSNLCGEAVATMAFG